MALHIGLDFDETITLDFEKWEQLILLMLSFGWRVSIVSIRQQDPHEKSSHRNNNKDIFDYAHELGVAAFTTHGVQKKTFMEQHGLPVDIWIDDSPETIPTGTTLLGMAIGCKVMNEAVDPNNELPGYIVMKDEEKK